LPLISLLLMFLMARHYAFADTMRDSPRAIETMTFTLMRRRLFHD